MSFSIVPDSCRSCCVRTFQHTVRLLTEDIGWCFRLFSPSLRRHYSDFFATMASADFSSALTEEGSPGKVPKLSARAVRLYLACLSVTVGFRGPRHTYRPYPASLPVRVPTVVPLLHASFRLASRLPPCATLRLLSLLPVTSFQVTSFGPCRAHLDTGSLRVRCMDSSLPKGVRLLSNQT